MSKCRVKNLNSSKYQSTFKMINHFLFQKSNFMVVAVYTNNHASFILVLRKYISPKFTMKRHIETLKYEK